MRDIILTLFIFGCIPYVLMKPHVGILMWSWIGYMNPHRLTWGFAYSLPFAQIIAIATLFAALFSKEKKQLPVTPITIVLILFIILVSISTIFSLEPESALKELVRVYKIQLVIFLTMIFINNRERINQLVWVIAGSLSFYGIKGGVFSALTGGGLRVWGPPGSFIEGNNELGLALLMTIPLLFYLRDIVKKKWQKNLIFIMVALLAVSILSTYSRGAFLALVMMAIFLWFKMPNKLPAAIIGCVLSIGLLSFMPDKFYERMNTIETYEEDASAMGRINAWTLAVNIAQDRFFAGGFNHWSAKTFQQYAPIPDDVHDAHSIYFEVLGEQGFFGLFLFLLLYFLTWKKMSWIIKKTKFIKELKWCNTLTKMIQVSLIGYATGGAFLGLAYWDMPYHLIALVVVMGKIVESYQPEPVKDEILDKVKKSSSNKRKKWKWEQ